MLFDHLVCIRALIGTITSEVISAPYGLAYITKSELVIMNVRTRSLQHISLPSPIPRTSDSINMTISWSPDGQRLLIQHWDLDPDQYGVYLFEVTDSAIKMVAVDFPDRASPDIRSIRWISPTELVDYKDNTAGYDEIKRYDVMAQRSTIALSGVECATFYDEFFSFAYRVSPYVITEAQSADGFSLLFRRALQLETVMACRGGNTPYAQITSYALSGGTEIVRIATHDPSQILRISSDLSVTQANGISWGVRVNGNRFIILRSAHGGDARVLDLKTRQYHRMPADVPAMELDHSYHRSIQRIEPAPDEASSWYSSMGDYIAIGWGKTAGSRPRLSEQVRQPLSPL